MVLINSFMNKFLLGFGLILGLCVCDVSAQVQNPEIIDGAFKREEKTRRTNDLYTVRQADAMFSWSIIRLIDLNQKPNFFFTYPKSMFINYLMGSLKGGELEGYIYKTEDLVPENAITSDAILKSLESYDTVITMDPVTYEMVQKVEKKEFDPNDVVGIRLKEEWVFDRRTGGLDVRIVALAPISNLKSEGRVVGQTAMFWVYYPYIRPLLTNSEVFNWRSESEKLNYDEVFIRRMFTSNIIKEPNVKDLRVEDYAKGRDAFYESERIKNKLLDFEQSLWQY
jgi:gliding motility associated protien GldN